MHPDLERDDRAVNNNSHSAAENLVAPDKNTKMPRVVAELLLLLLGCAADDAPQPRTITELLNVKSASALMMQHEKVILLLHMEGCPRAEEFTPKLQAIADLVPNVAFGRADVDKVPNLNAHAAVKALVGMPQLKAYFRNAPPGKRVLVYQGQATQEAVLAWAQAIEAWDGSGKLPTGWEVGSSQAKDAASSSSTTRSSSSSTASKKDEV